MAVAAVLAAWATTPASGADTGSLARCASAGQEALDAWRQEYAAYTARAPKPPSSAWIAEGGELRKINQAIGKALQACRDAANQAPQWSGINPSQFFGGISVPGFDPSGNDLPAAGSPTITSPKPPTAPSTSPPRPAGGGVVTTRRAAAARLGTSTTVAAPGTGSGPAIPTGGGVACGPVTYGGTRYSVFKRNVQCVYARAIVLRILRGDTPVFWYFSIASGDGTVQQQSPHWDCDKYGRGNTRSGECLKPPVTVGLPEPERYIGFRPFRRGDRTTVVNDGVRQRTTGIPAGVADLPAPGANGENTADCVTRYTKIIRQGVDALYASGNSVAVRNAWKARVEAASRMLAVCQGLAPDDGASTEGSSSPSVPSSAASSTTPPRPPEAPAPPAVPPSSSRETRSQCYKRYEPLTTYWSNEFTRLSTTPGATEAARAAGDQLNAAIAAADAACRQLPL